MSVEENPLSEISLREITCSSQLEDQLGEEENTLTESKWLPNSLLIGSGGARGYMFLGALHRLYAENYLHEIKEYAGVSIGSAISFLLACGLTPRDIWREVKHMNSADLAALSTNVIKHFGLFTMVKVKSKLRDILHRRLGRRSLTFQELFDLKEKELHILSFNTTKKKGEIFNRTISPNMDIIDAVCMSCSIPLLFEPYVHQGSEYTDGAMYDPYPIYILDREEKNVLGLYIDDYVSTTDHLSRINAIITGNLDSKRNENIERASERCKHICIYSQFLDTTGISLDANKKVTLMASGDTSVVLWIQEQEEKKKEDAKFTYMKAVLGYDEMLMEESDEEQNMEITRETFTAHEKEEEYNDDYLN